MAKTPEKVCTFLCDLEKRLQALKQQEMDIFLQYKKEDVCPLAGFIFCLLYSDNLLLHHAMLWHCVCLSVCHKMVLYYINCLYVYLLNFSSYFLPYLFTPLRICPICF